MKTVLHLTPSGSQYWLKGRDAWQPHDGPPSGPVWVVTDLAEEGFAEIQIPRIFGRDRQNYVSRQVSSRFPDTPYRTTLPVKPGGGLMDRIAPPRQTLLGLDAATRVNLALDSLPGPLAGVWSTSMLLTTIACRKPLPPELFVVLPGPDALRIVVIKNRLPVLTRLIAGVTQPSDQVAEVVRTLRHLENTRVLDRSVHRHGVLVLGATEGMATALAAEHLDLLLPPPPWGDKPPGNWLFALFDLALKSPVGQLAPLSRRTQYVATQLRQAAYIGAAISLGVSLWAAGDNLRYIVAGQVSHSQIQANAQALAVKMGETDQKMVGFGVAAETVRAAVALDRDEVSTAPSLALQLHQLGSVIGQHEAVRLGQLAWTVLPPGRPACGGGAAGVPGAPAGAEAPASQRVVEVSFDLTLPEDLREKARAQTVISVSAGLAKVDGANLIRDPAKGLDKAALSGGGTRAGTDKALSWCLTLAGAPKPPSPT
jgi:hypothetical protein